MVRPTESTVKHLSECYCKFMLLKLVPGGSLWCDEIPNTIGIYMCVLFTFGDFDGMELYDIYVYLLLLLLVIVLYVPFMWRVT